MSKLTSHHAERTCASIETQTMLTKLRDLTSDIDNAGANGDWADAQALEAERFKLLGQLPAEVFADTREEVRGVLVKILESARSLEAKALAERTRCNKERMALRQNKRAHQGYAKFKAA